MKTFAIATASLALLASCSSDTELTGKPKPMPLDLRYLTAMVSSQRQVKDVHNSMNQDIITSECLLIRTIIQADRR